MRLLIPGQAGKEAGFLRGNTFTPITYDLTADSMEAADWARSYVAEAVRQGIVKGKPGNLFAPADSATRAEAAAMVARMMVNLSK